MDQIIKKVTAKLLSMLDPTGIMAVVNSAIALYKAIQSFIKYLRKMLEIVNSFVEGTLQIAQGATKKAADFLEGALARGIPIVIGFLANQVGLNLSERLRDALELVREKVDKGLTWVIDKLVVLVEKLVSFGKAAVGTVMGWLGLRKDFNDTGGGQHSIYFEGSGNSAQLHVASYNPKTVRTLLNAVSSVINLPANSTHLQSYQDAVALVTEIDTIKNRLNNPSNANSDQDNSTMNEKLILLAAKLPPFMTMVGGTEPPPLVKPAFANGVKASSFEVAYIKKGRTSGGSGANTNSGATLMGWSKINQSGLSAGSAWVKMHLLTEQLGGPALDSNLTPARGPQTNTVAYNQVEKHAIEAVDQGKTIWYKIDIGYYGPPDENYANNISIEFGSYQYSADSNQWERKAKGTVIDGKAVGTQSFSQSPAKPDFSGAVSIPNLNDTTVGRVVIQNIAAGLSRPFAEFVQAVRSNGGFSDPNDLESKLITAHTQRVIKIENFDAQLISFKNAYNKSYTIN
jgi:hypothetical protein